MSGLWLCKSTAFNLFLCLPIATNCPALGYDAYATMKTLSEGLLQSTCEKGFVYPDGQTSRTFYCQSNGQWNQTDEEMCQCKYRLRKRKPN